MTPKVCRKPDNCRSGGTKLQSEQRFWNATLTVAPLYIRAASGENLVEMSDPPVKRTALEVTDFLANHLTGTERPHEWDEFTSVPIADPRLEGIRLRCVQLENEETDVRVAELKSALRLLQHLQHVHHI